MTHETTLNGERLRFGPVYSVHGVCVMPIALGDGATLRLDQFLFTDYPTQEQFDAAVAVCIDKIKE